jgi:hypothetical protein
MGIAFTSPSTLERLLKHGEEYVNTMKSFEDPDAFACHLRTMSDNELFEFTVGALINQNVEELAMTLQAFTKEMRNSRSEMN